MIGRSAVDIAARGAEREDVGDQVPGIALADRLAVGLGEDRVVRGHGGAVEARHEGPVDVLGRRYGLPRAMSGHNSYWTWGPGTRDVDVLIIIGGDRPDNARFFSDIEIVGQTTSPWCMPYERGLDVSIGRRPKVDLRSAWPTMRLYI